MSPQSAEGRGAIPAFAPEELLFRRVPYSHIEEGEVNALAIASETKFDPDPKKCTSVLRSAYTELPLDALHPDCAGGDDLSKTHTIRYVTVGELPKGLKIDPPPPDSALRWDTYAHHDPLPQCFAHSTICCCNQNEPGKAVEPPRSVRKQFREWFAAELKPSEAPDVNIAQSNCCTSASPPTRGI